MCRERTLKVELVPVGIVLQGWRLSPDRLFIASVRFGYWRLR